MSGRNAKLLRRAWRPPPGEVLAMLGRPRKRQFLVKSQAAKAQVRRLNRRRYAR